LKLDFYNTSAYFYVSLSQSGTYLH
jgi:hypothetical protein